MEKPKIEYKIGNTKIIGYSILVTMTPKERSEWFKKEWERGNPILKEIAAAVEHCYRDK